MVAINAARIRKVILNALTINFHMLPCKLTYILYGGILGLHLPFVNIFFRSVGLSTRNAGFITGMRYISSSLSGPLWGILADYTGRRKLIMVVICIGCALPISAMPWVAQLINPAKNINPCVNTTAINETISTCEAEWRDDIDLLFYVFLAIIVFGSIFVISMPGYVDTIAINVVKNDPKEASYGAQRIFGSIGFSAFLFLGGFIADEYTSTKLSKYTGVFFMYFPICILLIPCGCYLVGQGKWDEERRAGPSNTNTEVTMSENQLELKTKGRVRTWWHKSISRKVVMLMKKFDVAFFMTTVFISGLSNSLFLSFSLMLVEDTFPGISKSKMTLITVTGSVSELLIFPFATRIIKKLGGTSPCIIIGTSSYIIRFLGMSYVREYWIVVLLQALHGLGFALTWSAMMEYTYKISPHEIVDTMFGILSGVFYSVAALIANMVGGVVYDKKGGKFLFWCTGVICGVWTLIMIIYYGGRALRKKLSSSEDDVVKYNVNEKSNEINIETGIVNPVAVFEEESAEERLEC